MTKEHATKASGDWSTVIHSSSILKNSPTPLYVQVAVALRRAVAGKKVISHALPPEHRLTELLGVSRVTLRKATDILEAEGLLVRQHGKGTFIRTARLEYPLDAFRGIEAAIERMKDRHVTSEVVRFAVVPGDEEVRRYLRLSSETENVRFVRRLERVDGMPVAVADIFLPRGLVQRIRRSEFATHALYPLLQDRQGLFVEYVTQTIESIGCPPDAATLLQLRPGDPVTHVERIATTTDGRAVEYSRTRYAAGAVRFSVSLHRAAAGTHEETALGFDQLR